MQKPSSTHSWLWLIPIFTLIGISVGLWWMWSDRGRLISIQFVEGHGIEPGDELRYHGIVAGDVEAVRLTPELDGVIMDVRLMPESDQLGHRGSRFWIVRPRLDIAGVTGLDTLIGSKYLTVLPVDHDEPLENSFVGLEEAPVRDLQAEGGIEIILQSSASYGYRPGIAVMYRNLRIGGVLRTGLASDGGAVETTVYIRPEYQHLIRENTRFWNASGIFIEGGLTNIDVHIGPLETLVRGGIGVAVPPEPGNHVSDGHRFELARKPEEEWLEWRPALADGIAMSLQQRPKLIKAKLTWIHDGLLSNSTQQREGWVIPTAVGLIGPKDLLSLPEDAIDEKALLVVEETEITLTADEPKHSPLSKVGDIVRLSVDAPGGTATDVARWKPSTSPQDGLLISGPNSPPKMIAASRYQQSNGQWLLDAGLGITQGDHGAVIVSPTDGAILSIVTVDGKVATATRLIDIADAK